MNKNGDSLPPCKIIRESSSLSRALYEDVLKIDLRDSAGYADRLDTKYH